MKPDASSSHLPRREFLTGTALTTLATLLASRTAAPRRIGKGRSAAPATSLPREPRDLTLFTINNPPNRDMQLSYAPPWMVRLDESVPSQSWQRAWFKWGSAVDWNAMRGEVTQAHGVGALFGGGTTCSALFPRENGITTAEFMDMATRDPDGNLYKVSNSYYHGSVECPAYRRYVLKWATLQIDAGADTLFMDEVNGAYSDLEGYDTYGLAAFRRYLIHRFVTHQRWRIDDHRWKSEFGIELSNPRQCPDGTMRTFDYAVYLRENHWAHQPQQPGNPLAGIWGTTLLWELQPVSADTYCAWRSNSVWRYWTTQIRAYAARRHRRVWLAANGLNRWVDFQIGADLYFWQFPRSRTGQLDCTSSYLSYWRSYYAKSRALMNGKDVPIMIFHDWGGSVPWIDQLTDAQRVAWIHAYAPEVFAAGLFFAYPVLGPGGYNAATDGTLKAIESQARFVKMVSPLLRDVTWQEPKMARYSGRSVLTVQKQPRTHRVIIHLINRRYQGLTPINQVNQVLHVATTTHPKAIRIYNADTGRMTSARWAFDRHAKLPGGQGVRIDVPSLRTWNIIDVLN